ncbi:hypothetical protein AB1Y20_014785 [Prymnesium parvum]|uniref:Protein xylosyltransferase n=1 Tax=Prymnesium parvum TaxID=97485 RepID=A0AB34IDW6_PRYPA
MAVEAAFVTSHFLPSRCFPSPSAPSTPSSSLRGPDGPCEPHLAALLHWSLQTHALADLLASLSSARHSLHLFSECLDPAWEHALSTPRVAFRVHEAHRAELRAAVAALHSTAERFRCCPDWRQPKAATLYKWEVMAMVEARVVVFLDLDLEVLPQRSLRLLHRRRGGGVERKVASTWHQLLSCFLASNYSLLATPDHSSPVNAALMIARPSLPLYREGVDVLSSAAGRPFDFSRGWRSVGTPKAVLPAADAAWWRRPGQLEMLDWNSWRFVGASIDQGFFFYMTRLLHTHGTDLRTSACAAPSRDGVSEAAEHTTYFYHFGAHGGPKPERIAAAWRREARPCAARLVGAAAGSRTAAEALGRAAGWARRAAAALGELSRAPLAAAAAAQLRPALRQLEGGVRCVNESLAAWLAEGRRGGLPPSAVAAIVGGGEELPRAISLRAAACASCRWASYTAKSRYAEEHTADA